MNISLIELEHAVKSIYPEIESTEGVEAMDLIFKFIEQEKQKRIENKTYLR